MSEDSKKKESFDKKNSGKRLFYLVLEHSRLVEITLDRDEKIERLENEKTELRNELLELRYRLKAHEPEKYDPPNYMGYQQNWSGIRKVIFILKRNVRALTSSQVMQELLRLEPLYKQVWRDPANNVSGLLSRALKKNLLIRLDAPGMGVPAYKVIRKKH